MAARCFWAASRSAGLVEARRRRRAWVKGWADAVGAGVAGVGWAGAAAGAAAARTAVPKIQAAKVGAHDVVIDHLPDGWRPKYLYVVAAGSRLIRESENIVTCFGVGCKCGGIGTLFEG